MSLDDEALPPYRPPETSIRRLTAHRYTTECASAAMTMSLTVKSHAQDSNSSPLFYNGTKIAGTLEASLVRKLKVKKIVVMLRGFERVGVPCLDHQRQELEFLQQPVTLWSSSSSSLSAGTHSWSFSIAIPLELHHWSREQLPSSIPLPPTFMPNHRFPFFLMYELLVVAHRGFLQTDERIKVPIRYAVRSKAATPGDLRRLAYEDGSPLIAPEVDPLGWASSSVRLMGKFFGQRDVEILCTFSIASPPSFPRGYPIPFFVTIQTSDQQVLDIATSSAGVMVALERNYAFASDAYVGYADINTTVTNGQFWATIGSESNSKTLQGEIPVPFSVTPTFSCPTFSLKYTVTFSLQVSGLHPNAIKSDRPLLAIPVEIAHSSAPGPRPRSYAPASQ